MQITNIPVKIPIRWADSAGTDYIRNIPNASQIGITDGRASYTDGFVPDNFVNEAAGGIPPDGRDFNGVLQDITDWLRWAQAGGPIRYDSTFATNASVNGYPLGAVLSGNTVGQFYVNTTDNNTTNPNSGGAGWNTLSSYILANAALTGNPTAPTQTANDGSTKVANTFYSDRVGTNAVAAAQSYATAHFLPFTGGTITGASLTIGDNVGGTTLAVNGAAGSNRLFYFQTAGVTRWDMRANATAEGGADTGSDWQLIARHDDGSVNGGVLSFNRATRVGTFNLTPLFPTLSQGSGATTPTAGATVLYADLMAFGPSVANRVVTGSRNVGSNTIHTTYTNTFGKALQISLFGKTTSGSSTAANIDIVVDGVIVASCGIPQVGVIVNVNAWVPAGSTYYAALDQPGTFTGYSWIESR